MDIKDIKKLKVGSFVNWHEQVNGKRTGYRLGYTITRINYKRGLVWGTPTNDHMYWKHNSIELQLHQIEVSSWQPQ